MSDYTYIGKNTPVTRAWDKADGSLTYVGDMMLPRMLHMKLVLSPIAHGMITSIDSSRAEALPGVRGVFTFENTPSTLYNRGRVRSNEEAIDQEVLFSRHVRFVGDRVAAVVADTPELAAKGAELITMTYETLPAVYTTEDMLRNVEPEDPFEQVVEISKGYGDYDQAPGQVFTHHCSSQRLTHVTMETHGVVADYHRGSRMMTIWTPTQSVFGARSIMKTLTGLPLSHIRAIKTPMGGSFGSKQEMILEPVVGYAAYVLARPVKLVLNRREEILCSVVKHPVDTHMEVKFTPEGVITGMRIRNVLDAGAYQTVTPDYAVSIYNKFSWTYDIPHIDYQAKSVCTNLPISGGYRGWGGPEAGFLMESMMNAAAKHYHMDPIDFRLQNILPPYATSRINDYCLGNLPLKECLLKGKDAFDWDRRRAMCEGQDPASRYKKGVGMSLITHTSGYYPRKNDWSTVILKLEEDGTVSANCNIHDHGCGEVTALQMIAAEVLGIDPDDIAMPEGDTLYNMVDNGCYTSRTIYVAGRAMMDAAKLLLDKINGIRAMILAADPGRETIPDFSEVAFYAIDHDCGDITVKHTHQPQSNPGPAVASFAEVEVDTLTGLCRVTDFLAVHDIGKAINPEVCRGQIGSALQQAMGIVFCEELRVDPYAGTIRNASLQKYHVARSFDLPRIRTIFLENGSEEGPYGAKSIGEAAYVPIAPALLEAVNHALGTEFAHLPVTPEKIVKALN